MCILLNAAPNTVQIYSILIECDMENVPADLWTAACAHRLQQQWHTVDPLELEEVARDLWRDARLRAMSPDEAAIDWLRPITQAGRR